ncbi:MAG TPA: hypothetical protein PLW81_14625 [Thiobacillaceae bacterium]|nr:hypothetical protein [Thiobacillaceae bacterium]
MKTDPRDYLYSTLLIGLILSLTAGLVYSLQNVLLALLGSLYAPIALLLLLLAAYGGATALVLALLHRLMPLNPGSYRTSHAQFALWKVQHVVGELGRAALSLFFPVFARQVFYALFGARVGKNVAVGGKIVDPRLTVLEDGCVIGEGAIVACHAMARGRFLLRGVRVGRGATVGGGAILMHGVTIGAGAVVLPGSLVMADSEIPEGEVWGGLPAVRIKGAKRHGATKNQEDVPAEEV